MKNLVNNKKEPLYYIVHNLDSGKYSKGILNKGHILGTSDNNKIHKYRKVENFIRDYFKFTGIDIKKEFEIDIKKEFEIDNL